MTVASLSLMQYKIFQFYSLPTYFTIFHDFRFCFFFSFTAEWSSIVCVEHILSMCSSGEGHPGRSLFLAIVNRVG